MAFLARVARIQRARSKTLDFTMVTPLCLTLCGWLLPVAGNAAQELHSDRSGALRLAQAGHIATGDAKATGVISGVISNAKTRAQLRGVAVSVSGRDIRTTTDTDGRFFIPAMAPGEYELIIEQAGYASQTRSVRVSANTATQINVQITRAETVAQLQELKVEGSRAARAASLQRKRDSLNIREVTTADEVGKLPDQNLAEALSRLTGVSLQQDKNEGRFVSIRGVAPELNQVNVNGQATAAPDVDGRAGRAAPLDVVGIGNFSTVEVIKTLTPDLDAQGVGGQINVLAPSAFDHAGKFGYVTADGGINSLETDADIWSGKLGFGNTFFDRRLGVFLGGEYSKREFRTENLSGSDHELVTETGPDGEPLNAGFFVPETLRISEFRAERERIGFTGNVEFQPDEASEYYTRVLYSKFDQDEVRPEVAIERDGNVMNQTPTSGQFSEGTVALESAREVTERSLLNLSFGGSHRYGIYSEYLVEYDLTFSQAKENNPILQRFQFETADNQPVTYDTSSRLFTFTTQGPSRFDPANFVLDEFRFETGGQEERLLIPSIDWTWNRSLFSYPGAVKIGAKISTRDRFVDDNSPRFNDSGTPFSLEGFAKNGPDQRGYTFGPTPDQQALTDFFNANPDRFAQDPLRTATNSVEDDYDIDENILAGYVQVSADIDQLSVLGGVRIERTQGRISANQINDFDGDPNDIVDSSGTIGYDNIFPNLQARYAFTDSLILRGAYSTSIGRPDFVDLAPISEFEAEDEITPGSGRFEQGTFSSGNPTLTPFEASNFDFAVEYYLANDGIVSVGVFYKIIDNPIFVRQVEQNNVNFQGLFFEDLDIQTTENAEDGSILGLELIYQQQFTFLPGLLKGLGLSLNAAFIDSEVTVFDRDDDLPFFTQPDRVANYEIFYQYGIVDARVAYRMREDFLETLGGGPQEDIFQGSNTQLDSKISLNVTPRVSVYAQGSNLTNERFRRYQGNPNRLAGSGSEGDELYGRTFRLGTAINFE